MPPTPTPTTGFDSERLRKKLLAQGKIKQLLQAYSKKYPVIQAPIKKQQTARFWDQIFQDTVIQSPMDKDRNRWATSQVQRNSQVLNLGVGSGYLEKCVFEKLGNQVNWTGTDITLASLKKIQQQFPDYQFVATNLKKLPFKNKTFDTVLLLETLEHIKPKQTFEILKEVKRVLAKDGKFIVSVPVNEGLEEIAPNNPSAHFRDYSEELFRFELEQAGFKVQKINRLTAFAKFYELKKIINQFLGLRHANNILILAEK